MEESQHETAPDLVSDSDPEFLAPDSMGQAIRRGLSLTCPLCGAGQLFRGLLRMHERCDQCRYRFERSPGYFLGSTYINYGVTTLFATWSWILLRFGLQVERWVLIPPLAVFCVIFPLVFFRYARSLWLSIDTFLDRQGALEQRDQDSDFD
jgi:uncharacterized protein (DUF983 family)